MHTKIQKWGNSLALRIPKSFADEIGLHNDVAVDLAPVDGKLVVTPIPSPAFVLEDLVAGITDDNVHTEIDTGHSVGREVW
ncbi:MAG: AbrB/MazE/SpoVT family DNA-binding domain-containing protein [Chloroflexi bacterium AL-W]|nr:AbrB/MazE/SpoVT family DNA-binding domain-containing protein [Chloroflexi bacterium AL-N1]NOK71172.1 AbrB/MazE/SpoVT family DNA-binding domain-containing protein [Chloroflexi bacterium AL-N10]NOK78638.1 AbrB/MazE/SpoVT family DNA-binding domain-containing protein [Chloroflexi bacterium AL-N5]NOK85934.1 AbrB/MazE/SpoVT family DNA-binding domain-containing protein [Chloroflexi bacterium AL-W]NOK92909.1 AbrB/MazE/SpoVT family DNA-binding domain-containing protein [Chloroflexi bacterium AL-N15]